MDILKTRRSTTQTLWWTIKGKAKTLENDKVVQIIIIKSHELVISSEACVSGEWFPRNIFAPQVVFRGRWVLQCKLSIERHRPCHCNWSTSFNWFVLFVWTAVKVGVCIRYLIVIRFLYTGGWFSRNNVQKKWWRLFNKSDSKIYSEPWQPGGLVILWWNNWRAWSRGLCLWSHCPTWGKGLI